MESLLAHVGQNEHETQALTRELRHHYPDPCAPDSVCAAIISARARQLSGCVAADLLSREEAIQQARQESETYACGRAASATLRDFCGRVAL